MIKSRFTSRFVALILAMLTMVCMVFAFSGTEVYAAASLSSSGATKMKALLQEDVSSNIAINKYKSAKKSDFKAGTLGAYYAVPLRSNDGDVPSDDDMKKAGDVAVYLFEVKGNTFKFNGSSTKGFQDITDSAFQQAMINEFAKLMADKYRDSFTDADRAAIYNEVKDNCGSANAAMVAALFQDTKADMFSALRLFQPFNGIVGTLLGICVLALVVLLIGSTALDMAYINFPIARNFMYGKDKEGGGDKNGGAKKPWGVTADAWSVVNECEGSGGSSSSGGGKYKNANIAYFKRRIITYIVVSIMILYLLSGQIASLIGWLMSLVSGFGG